MRTRKFAIPMCLMLAACGPARGKNPPREGDRAQQSYLWKKRNLPINGRYSLLPIEFYIDQEATTEQQLAIESAAQSWNNAVGFDLLRTSGLRENPLKSNPTDPFLLLNDGAIGVWFANDWSWMENSENAAGTTLWCFTHEESEIGASDIYLNADENILGNFLKAPELEGLHVDTESLALHEFGHLLGLSHTTEEWDPNSVMHPVLPPFAKRQLTDKDIAIVRALYRDEWDERLRWFQNNANSSDSQTSCGKLP
ncbi:MAG: matrixin family metalloprotease [Oligoflexales bacterium]